MTHSHLLKTIFLSQLVLGFITTAHADSPRPDDHAPIGVMRDHVHKQNEYMFSYRYQLMNMKGVRSGEDDVSLNEVLSQYMMSPRKMEMKMHMVGAMYGMTDHLTLAAMGSFIEKNMHMVNRHYQNSNREISGFGDLKLQSMYQFFKNEQSRAQLNFGLSIPSGSIKEKMDNGTRAAYPMQLGSGSYDLLPGISYSGFTDSYSYGGQINAVLRLNNNNNDYQLGDSYNVTLWTAKKLNEALSVSSRLDYTVTQKITGKDVALNTMMSPPNNTSSSGSRKLNFLLGANFIVPNGALKGHRLAIEGGVPLYQHVNGIQLKTDYVVTVGWQKSF